MTISPVGASHTRYQVMDFSTPLFMDETTVIYIRPRPMADMMGFIKPYTPLVSIAALRNLLYIIK